MYQCLIIINGIFMVKNSEEFLMVWVILVGWYKDTLK